MTVSDIEYELIKEKSILGRYVNHQHIDPLLKSIDREWPLEVLGSSVQNRNIYSLTIGNGSKRILIWSQMHGNESTTTKAVLDLINTLKTNIDISREILKSCTIKIIPLLNPDGAMTYTRENANKIDLNRDAQKLSQPESRILNSLYKNFKPDYCFNLHDQRTIYSAGKKSNPATLSFLSPAAEETRGSTFARKISMQLIVAMYHAVESLLGDCVGRYDDSFNLNCTGDTFQSLGTPTVLLEAGHYPGDYEREETRKYIWHVLLTALLTISKAEIDQYSIDQYMAIPSNEKLFFDILVRNAEYLSSKYKAGQSVGILYREVLQKQNIEFRPEIEMVGNLDDHFGHVEYDCQDTSSLGKLRTQKNLLSLLI